MPDPQIVWRRLSSLVEPPAGIADEVVVSSFLSKVFHFSEGRNAYWGSWSSSYSGDSSFHLDQAVLKKRIESRRKQGSQFTLTELPALALMATSYDLLLFQTWGSKPFKKVPSAAISGKSMFEIARSICKHEQWIDTFIVPRGESKLPILPFKTFRSSPQGPGHSLGWDRLQSKYDLSSIMDLVADVTLHLNNEG